MLQWTVYLKGEPKRYHKAAVAVGHRVYSFGGYCYDETYQYNMGQIDVHIFHTVSLRWRKLPPVTAESGERPLEVPSMRYDHTAVLIEDTIYIWGGSSKDTREDSNVLYAFDIDTHRWFKPDVSGTVPEARYFHSACVLGQVMYIYGGCTRCTDIYKLDTTTMVWSLINTGSWQAPASFWHSATIIGTKMFLFGGIRHHDVDPYHNIRVFDTETNSWLSMPSAQLLPEARWSHSAFAYNGELYIFGGATRSFNDFWKFNLKTFSWAKVHLKGNGPCTRMSFMCCCMVGDRIILFGGYSTPDDLFILDLSPCLKTLCKLAVIQYRLEQSELPHNIRWELAAMTTNSNRKRNSPLKKK